jgi:glycerophosphoryl diester phosphodiesterase
MKIKRFVFQLGSIFFLINISVNLAQASCLITKDDGNTYTNTDVNSCGELYPGTHYCSLPFAQQAGVCDSMNALISVDWSATDDIGIALHRGLWGYKMSPNTSTQTAHDLNLSEDVPQNSPAAFLNASIAGYKMVEIDVILNYRENNNQQPSDGVVMVNHYTDLTGMSDYSGTQSDADRRTSRGFLQNTPNNEVSPLYLRPNWERVITNNQNNELVSFEELIERFAAQNITDIVMIIDPIWLRNKTFTPNLKPFNRDPFNNTVKQNQEYIELVKKVLKIAFTKQDISYRIVIKTSQRMGSAATLLALPHAGEVLWAPNPDLSNQSSALTYINGWQEDYLAFVEIVANSDTEWYAKSFTYEGTTYDDISDYIKLDKNRRTGLWVIDPLTRYGSNSIFYVQANWFGNYPNDRKGEYIWQVNKLKYARHGVITTDRPEGFSRIRNLIN